MSPRNGPIAVYWHDRREVDFIGAGPRLGANLAVPIGGSNFSLLGMVAGAVMLGRRRTRNHPSSLVIPSTGTTVPITFGRKKTVTKAIYSLDAELGISYLWVVSPTTSLKIAAGYRVEARYDFLPVQIFRVFVPDPDAG